MCGGALRFNIFHCQFQAVDQLHIENDSTSDSFVVIIHRRPNDLYKTLSELIYITKRDYSPGASSATEGTTFCKTEKYFDKLNKDHNKHCMDNTDLCEERTQN